METPLMRSAAVGNVSKVRELRAEYSGRQNNAGFTALMKAISYKHLEAARLLVNDEAGASTDTGHTALMLAAQYGFVDLVKQLIPAEAGQQNKEGWSALMIALNNRQKEVAHLLVPKEAGLSKADGWTALMFAAQAGYADIVSLLLHTEKSRQSNKGWTALMIAADSGATNICKILLSEAGMRKIDGITAMMIAARRGHSDIVQLLLNKEFGLRTLQGQTAYSFAFAAGHRNVCALLSEESGDKDMPQTITRQALIPIESTLCTADLAGQSRDGGPLQTVSAADQGTLLEIDMLKKTIESLSMQLNSSVETVASLERIVNRQTAQINELYILIGGILQNRDMSPLTVKLPSSAEEVESSLVSIPVRPDHNTQNLSPDPSIFDLPPNCLHSAEFTTVPEGVEEDRPSLSSSPTRDLASSDTSLDIVCLPCEHICHFASLAQLEASKKCVICEMSVDDYIEVNTK
ncbi:Ankyrin repeat protein 1 [Giardia duodenalis]|uniref:Ankyrin repeat protein 1 n=1 Tax=Giardia intestinalis (strain ATCC 50803 / WB clone C6) TaxID=184922 RepID=A0A644F9C0_GIAIC|nr:Ankyrin repeat protein 1 [Giardia intestinalis]KAE8305234.1 Ankyrin repeat protein 1 [Giardia intestinalis]